MPLPPSTKPTLSPEKFGFFFARTYLNSEGTSFAAPAVTGTAALCISTGHCTGTPNQIINKLVADARAHNLAHPDYGFVGDPLRPIPGKYYGYLIRAGLY